MMLPDRLMRYISVFLLTLSQVAAQNVPKHKNPATITLLNDNEKPESCDMGISISIYDIDDHAITLYEWNNICLHGGRKAVSITGLETYNDEIFTSDEYTTIGGTQGADERPLAVAVTGALTNDRTLYVSVRDWEVADCVVHLKNNINENPTWATCTTAVSRDADVIFDTIGVPNIPTRRRRNGHYKRADTSDSDFDTKRARRARTRSGVSRPDEKTLIRKRRNTSSGDKVTFYTVELYIEIANSYFQAFRTDFYDAIDSAMATVAGANLIFERDLQITYSVSRVKLRGPDPELWHNNTEPTPLKTILEDWRSDVINNSGMNISTFEHAHLFLDVNTVDLGAAYQPGLCSDYKYSVSRLNITQPQVITDHLMNQDTLTHEFAHSWSAQHCDPTNNLDMCHSYTMFRSSQGTYAISPRDDVSVNIEDFRGMIDSATCLGRKTVDCYDVQFDDIVTLPSASPGPSPSATAMSTPTASASYTPSSSVTRTPAPSVGIVPSKTQEIIQPIKGPNESVANVVDTVIGFGRNNKQLSASVFATFQSHATTQHAEFPSTTMFKPEVGEQPFTAAVLFSPGSLILNVDNPAKAVFVKTLTKFFGVFIYNDVVDEFYAKAKISGMSGMWLVYLPHLLMHLDNVQPGTLWQYELTAYQDTVLSLVKLTPGATYTKRDHHINHISHSKRIKSREGDVSVEGGAHHLIPIEGSFGIQDGLYFYRPADWYLHINSCNPDDASTSFADVYYLRPSPAAGETTVSVYSDTDIDADGKWVETAWDVSQGHMAVHKILDVSSHHLRVTTECGVLHWLKRSQWERVRSIWPTSLPGFLYGTVGTTMVQSITSAERFEVVEEIGSASFSDEQDNTTEYYMFKLASMDGQPINMGEAVIVNPQHFTSDYVVHSTHERVAEYLGILPVDTYATLRNHQ
ncbi:hypothetical protein SARC_00529 [Sphaeroforma arctica JP610]|uniref:Peptidase M12B domain-containing protein n=1 Tax=Sphaeroforma arctica JP610 TaxID=667725 RepID=A0A0L0GGA7_9EUKA|nr:hypothetical protein SARC_00529 [Sphaeroforma arctica JP610]KNC87338.1 hypothetical protein SARC_00529 [Sphaeroforma arctica JP610]|eukprot:XP_014161240.1 hypothetical protein SARC_00529 [Sphaeroforma arctica JP610]